MGERKIDRTDPYGRFGEKDAETPIDKWSPRQKPDVSVDLFLGPTALTILLREHDEDGKIHTYQFAVPLHEWERAVGIIERPTGLRIAHELLNRKPVVGQASIFLARMLGAE